MDNMKFDFRSFILGVFVTLIAVYVLQGAMFREYTTHKYSTKGFFGQGREFVCLGNYTQAIDLLESYQKKYSQGKNISRAGLFLGKAYLGIGDYQKAKMSFEETINSYPESLEAHKSQYKLGLIAFFEEKESEAFQIFNQLAESPNGSLSPEAKAFRDYLTNKKVD